MRSHEAVHPRPLQEESDTQRSSGNPLKERLTHLHRAIKQKLNSEPRS